MPTTEGPGQVFTWSAHPARERSGRAFAAAVIVVGVAALCGALMGSVLWGAGAAAILLLSLNRFYLPSRFAIDDEGISARYPLRTQRCRWHDVRRFVHDAAGGYLSPSQRKSFLDAYRGMHVLFGEQRDAVITNIRAHMDHLQRDETAAEGRTT